MYYIIYNIHYLYLATFFTHSIQSKKISVSCHIILKYLNVESHKSFMQSSFIKFSSCECHSNEACFA